MAKTSEKTKSTQSADAVRLRRIITTELEKIRSGRVALARQTNKALEATGVSLRVEANLGACEDFASRLLAVLP